MADDPPSSAHDALFRKIFGTPAHMAEELRAVLPPAIAELLDLSSLLPLPMRFADAHLQGAESDLLCIRSACADPPRVLGVRRSEVGCRSRAERLGARWTLDADQHDEGASA